MCIRDSPNGEALAAVRTLAPGRALYIWGAAGCGRSHLLRALTARPDAVYIEAASSANILRVLAEADSKSPMPKFVAVDDAVSYTHLPPGFQTNPCRYRRVPRVD